MMKKLGQQGKGGMLKQAMRQMMGKGGPGADDMAALQGQTGATGAMPPGLSLPKGFGGMGMGKGLSLPPGLSGLGKKK